MHLPVRAPALEIRRQGNPTVVGFTGCDSLDEYNSETVGTELSLLAAGLPGPRLVLDFAGIRYVTSTALGQLVGLNRAVRSAGGRLTLANLAPAVQEVLAVTCLDRLLEVCPSAVAEASPRALIA
ncbi:MAG: STAS domain-containing protein [Planctomycetes bacterium]|nr:STAS domain-containing protein [Planctomycetota bacterium]